MIDSKYDMTDPRTGYLTCCSNIFKQSQMQSHIHESYKAPPRRSDEGGYVLGSVDFSQPEYTQQITTEF